MTPVRLRRFEHVATAVACVALLVAALALWWVHPFAAAVWLASTALSTWTHE